MHSTTFCNRAWLAVALVGLTGCQTWPETYDQGVVAATVSAQTRDAHLDHVKDHPGLRFDEALRDRLHTAVTTDDVTQARSLGNEVLEEAYRLALEVTHFEWERLDADQRQELRDHYYPSPAEAPADLWQQFVGLSQRDVGQLRMDLRQARDLAEVRRMLRSITDGLETPMEDQGRFGRTALWFPFFTLGSKLIANDIYNDEFRGNADVPFESATVYMPQAVTANSTGSMPWPDANDATLLTRFAPIIVQEDRAADATYSQQDDRIGHPTTPDLDSVVVATDHAEVYAYTRQIDIRGRSYTQLTYTHWYAEHPELKPNDPEAGQVEGVTLRITLDQNHRPAFFESVYNCGCYHRLYPSDDLELAAAEEFGEPMPGKPLAIERSVPWKYDLIVPNAVETSRYNPGTRPVIRVRAGWHGIVDVGFAVDKHANEPHTAVSYQLTPYEALERTVTPDGRATSIFYDNGLVKKAQRGEGVIFTPAGILSAGQPRQRGTQLIHWDHWNFDDPHLFEKALRLPAAF